MKNRKLKEVILKLAKEITEKNELDEITTTGDAEGYSTPFAFSGNKKTRKQKLKKALKSIGYHQVKEEIDEKDVKVIKKIIRSVVADIYRDIWLKRNAWK